MIASFKHRGLKRLYLQRDAIGVQPAHINRIENILFALQQARSIDDLKLPGFRLHALGGDLKGYWSTVVAANWRIIFRFEDGEAHDIELIDYH